MARRRQTRGVKVCAHCGGGYDAFKAMEVRGHYCSPQCLEGARAAHRLPAADRGIVPTSIAALGA